MNTSRHGSKEDSWTILLDCRLSCSALNAPAEGDWLARVPFPTKLRQARYDASIALLEVELISLVGGSDATRAQIDLSSHGLLVAMREATLGLCVEMFLPGTSEDSAMRYECTLGGTTPVAGVQVFRRRLGDALDRLTAELARATATTDEAFSVRIDLHSECGQLGFDLGPETVALLSRFPVEIHFSSQPPSPTSSDGYVPPLPETGGL